MRKGDSTAFVRMDAINEETLTSYYKLLEDTLQENKLQNCPSQIYNVDETGVPLNPKPPKIVVPKGMKKPRYQSPGQKGQITVVACGNAAGNVLPPLIIFDAKNMQHAWTQGEVPGSKYGTSDKGWITTELFESWFNELFLPNAVSARPLLLLLDGHSTHYQPDVINLALKNEVLILCLPPHTTHATQPLDCGVFSPLKSHWTSVCHEFIQKNPGRIITKFNFDRLFSQAWLRAVSPSNLIAGFKTCGVHPFNNKAVRPVPVHESAAKSSEGSTIGNIETVEEIDEISPELERKFRRRFEEGYNLHDPVYTRWLKNTHPELQPQPAEPSSVADEFSHIRPLSPEAVLVEETDNRLMESRQEVQNVSRLVYNSTTATDSREAQNGVSDGADSREAQNSVSDGATAQLGSSGLARVLADHTPLVAATERCKPKARLLTSAECLRMLQEKEDKKKQQLEEKERKRKEREQKKVLKEQEAQRKKEEKARKAQEKAEKALQRSSGQTSVKRTTPPERQNPKNTKRLKTSNNIQVNKETRDESIDVNTCCMCFGCYEDDVREGYGAEWMKCPCGRWLHVECVEDSVVDSSGQSRYCPYCIDGL